MSNTSRPTPIPMSMTQFKIMRFINKCIVSIMIFVVGFVMLFLEVAITLSFKTKSLIYNFGTYPLLEDADEEFIKFAREVGKLPPQFDEDNEVIRILSEYGRLPPRSDNDTMLIPPELEKIYNEMGIKIPKM
jgi:hypothetical protein